MAHKKGAVIVRGRQNSVKIKIKNRDCLRCDRVFLSEGAHNRLCNACRRFLSENSSVEVSRIDTSMR